MESTVPVTREKKLLNPSNNVIKLSSQTRINNWRLPQIFLKSHEKIEIHALGQANNILVRIVQQLQRDEVVVIDKIKFDTDSSKHNDKINQQMKLIVTLSRGKQFDELTQNIEVAPPQKVDN